MLCGTTIAELVIYCISIGENRVDNQQNDKESNYSTAEDATWGKWLFRGVIVLSLVFMWWLVIYPHGVVTHH